MVVEPVLAQPLASYLYILIMCIVVFEEPRGNSFSKIMRYHLKSEFIVIDNLGLKLWPLKILINNPYTPPPLIFGKS